MSVTGMLFCVLFLLVGYLYSIQIKETWKRSWKNDTTDKNAQAIEKKHVVQPGDSLNSIALRYYGTEKAAMKIYDANKDLLLSTGVPANVLYVGMSLTIPE